MCQNTKKAILAVSFGTSHNDTRKATIDEIEKALQEAFPEYPLYRAWTSKMIIRKLKNRDNVHINTIKEALEQMRRDGITDVFVQVLSYKDDFQSISFGNPLLTEEQDSVEVIDIIAQKFSFLKEDEVLVLMGHGTTHHANSVYTAIDRAFKDRGHRSIFLGTVEAYPSMETLLEQVREFQPSKVYLAPFMIVAGDHAKNDMAGEDKDSWYSRFKAEGYEVEPILKGLGEYPEIRRMFVEHLRSVIRA